MRHYNDQNYINIVNIQTYLLFFHQREVSGFRKMDGGLTCLSLIFWQIAWQLSLLLPRRIRIWSPSLCREPRIDTDRCY